MSDCNCKEERRKICVVTGSRAEYYILYWLLKEISLDKDLELKLIVSAMHLAPEFGLTYREIEKDFLIDKKVEMLVLGDSGSANAKSMGIGIIGFCDALEDLKPDILVLVGDRFESLAAASAALFLNIPIAHIHGGEITEAAWDDSIRHAITKMSHLHFTATDEYRKRVIQLGEDPNRVFNVGAPGLDNIKRLALLSKDELEKKLSFRFKAQNILVTFHPVTLESDSSVKQLMELLNVLEELSDLGIIFTGANADREGILINETIERFCKRHPDRSKFFMNLGQLLYLSTLKSVDAVVGNSSSGIIEAPALKTATVNIGDRQKGRVMSNSVINCEPTKSAIKEAITKALSSEFKEVLANVTSPYGDGEASVRIKDILKSFPIQGILKKRFYDISSHITMSNN